MYKDNEKQKEANRMASQRRRDKAKGMTRTDIGQGMTRTRTTGCKVAIPGDEDYHGCWSRGRLTKMSPYPVNMMTRQELGLAIKAYPHDQWINSPEHKELMSRLRTRSVAELEAEGYHVPAWKAAG